MTKRTARDFSRKQIWEIANSYANTGYEYSHDYYEREYKISKSTFYTILEKAVIEHIVNLDIVELMCKKAAYNSGVKAGEAGYERSIKHYDYLKKKRAQYRVSKKQAVHLTIKYSESKLLKNEFAKENYISTKMLDIIFKDAIINCWVSDEVVNKLKQKSLRQDSSQRVLNFWFKIENLRRENKNQG